MPVAESPVWSKSQVAAFRECERKHAFSTWMAPAGAETDERWARVRRLKGLSSRFLWPSSTVHSEIGEVLKMVRQGSPPPPLEDWLDRVRNTMRDQFRASRENTAEALRFFEHEYDIPVPRQVWAEPWAKVESSLRRFHGSAWLERFCSLGPECWKAIDEIISFNVGEIKAFVKIDCAIESDGQFTIVDWKTSPLRDEPDTGLQTAALYAHEVWGADPAGTQILAVSLLDGKMRRYPVDEELLMETHLRIESESQTFSNLDRNADPFQRPMTSNRQTCERCHFKKLCYPGEMKRAQQPC